MTCLTLHTANKDGGVSSPKLSHVYLVAENSLRDVTQDLKSM